jgi:hypothetical protein
VLVFLVARKRRASGTTTSGISDAELQRADSLLREK